MTNSPAAIHLRSLEEPHLEEIWRRQNGESRHEVSGLLDFTPGWAPMSKDQVRGKVEDIRKRERTALLAVCAPDETFVGLGHFTASWDARSPHLHVLIWPEHRRRGYGTAAARRLLEIAFQESGAHVVGGYTQDFEAAGIAFAESLGFRRAGVERRAGMKDGKHFDGIFWDLLRREWEPRAGGEG